MGAEYFKIFTVQIPTQESDNFPTLVKTLNELSGKPCSNGLGSTTQWFFESLSGALKGIIAIHEASLAGSMISHRLLCDGYSYTEFGDFDETEFFK